MKEVQALTKSIHPRQVMIKPAAEFPRSVEEAINSFSPRVVQFSGHGDAVRRGAFAGALAFETKDGP
jgi:hypothetical protein